MTRGQTVQRSELTAHKRTVEFDLAHITRFLAQQLGTKLVAYLAGVQDPGTVTRWANGTRTPNHDSELRLRTAFQVFQMLQAEESPHTVRAWFIGINPQLEDVSPVTALRDGRMTDLMMAARAYVSGG